MQATHVVGLNDGSFFAEISLPAYKGCGAVFICRWCGDGYGRLAPLEPRQDGQPVYTLQSGNCGCKASLWWMPPAKSLYLHNCERATAGGVYPAEFAEREFGLWTK